MCSLCDFVHIFTIFLHSLTFCLLCIYVQEAEVLVNKSVLRLTMVAKLI